MIRALVWKEWRSQRPLVLAGLGISAILPLFMMAGIVATTTNRNLAQAIDILAPALLLFVWPIMAAATGATTFAADGADESLRFVLSRPVSRARLWGVKVATGLAAFVAVVAGSLGILGLYWLAFGAIDERMLRNFFGDLLSIESLLAMTPFTLLFGCALYCSLFIRRPMAAALAGGLAALGMSTLIAVTWTAVMPSSPWVQGVIYGLGVAVGLPIGAVAVFAVGFWRFRRGDLMFDGRLEFLKPLVVITLVVMLMGAGPVIFGGLREISRYTARVGSRLVVIDNSVMLTEPTASRLSTRIVRMDVEGGGSEIVVPEHAALAAIAPDGEWFAYASFGSYLGVLSGRPHLRAARLDGSGDKRISSSTVEWTWGIGSGILTIAPDNDTVAYRSSFSDEPLLLASISSGTSRTVELAPAPDRDWMLGWVAQTSELLYAKAQRRRSAQAYTEIRAYDPGNGGDRLLGTFQGEHNFLYYTGDLYEPYTNGRTWTWFPVWLPNAGGATLSLLDTVSGELVELSTTSCSIWSFAGANVFVYGNCSNRRVDRGERTIELRTLDLTTRVDEPFATLTGFATGSGVGTLASSADGERFIVHARDDKQRPRASYATWILERGGAMRELMSGAIPVAWLDDRIVLVRSRRRQESFWKLDVETGERTLVYEIEER